MEKIKVEKTVAAGISHGIRFFTHKGIKTMDEIKEIRLIMTKIVLVIYS